MVTRTVRKDTPQQPGQDAPQGDKPTGDTLTPPGSEDLAALAEEAKALDAAATGAEPPAAPASDLAPAPTRDQATKDMADTLSMVVDGMTEYLKDEGYTPEEIRAIWTEERLHRIASSLAAVMVLHGLSYDAAMNKFGPYLMVTFSVAPPLIATVALVRSKRAQAAAAQQAQAHAQ